MLKVCDRFDHAEEPNHNLLDVSMAQFPNEAHFDPVPAEDRERAAVISRELGFHLRPPPAPHNLEYFITKDEHLFQTIHMGAVHVDVEKWRLVVTGLVARPFALTLTQLKDLPCRTITSFHECFGSPLKPATSALWRVGNVQWTGVPLRSLLDRAGVSAAATFVWSDGLDSGQFGGISADRYQKDLPMEKAREEDVLVAWEMNGEPLAVRRGGPVRLVVPGWFGTNSTKWLSKITVQDKRSPSHFTTTFYNEHNPPDDPDCASRPVWKAQPNSCIVRPAPKARVSGPNITVEGWAWSSDGVLDARISEDDGVTWTKAMVEPRIDFSWQRFSARVSLSKGKQQIIARATGADERTQPMEIGRNHVHRVAFEVV